MKKNRLEEVSMKTKDTPFVCSSETRVVFWGMTPQGDGFHQQERVKIGKTGSYFFS